MPGPACNRGPVDPSAIATRRTRLSLALTVGGAVIVMVGVSMMLIGEAMRLEQPAGWQQLISVGAVLSGVGLALGLACAVVVLAGPRVQVRAVPPRQSGDAAGYVAPDSAEGWLGPLRDAAVRPFSATARGTAAARAGTVGAGHGGAGHGGAGHGGTGHGGTGREKPGYEPVGPTYSDEGWRLDGTGPIAAQRPADPPREIHHPVRPMPAPRAPGQRLGTDTGQLPAYTTGPLPAYESGQLPAYDSGQLPAYDSGQLPAYEPGQLPAYNTGQLPAYDPRQRPAHDTVQRPAHDSGQLPAYEAERHSAYLPAPPGGPGS
jgi:hypothetical protein